MDSNSCCMSELADETAALKRHHRKRILRSRNPEKSGLINPTSKAQSGKQLKRTRISLRTERGEVVEVDVVEDVREALDAIERNDFIRLASPTAF